MSILNPKQVQIYTSSDFKPGQFYNIFYMWCMKMGFALTHTRGGLTLASLKSSNLTGDLKIRFLWFAWKSKMSTLLLFLLCFFQQLICFQSSLPKQHFWRCKCLSCQWLSLLPCLLSIRRSSHSSFLCCCQHLQPNSLFKDKFMGVDPLQSKKIQKKIFAVCLKFFIQDCFECVFREDLFLKKRKTKSISSEYLQSKSFMPFILRLKE